MDNNYRRETGFFLKIIAAPQAKPLNRLKSQEGL